MGDRMQKTQQLRESDYGKLTEYKVEKDIIAATASATSSRSCRS